MILLIIDIRNIYLLLFRWGFLFSQRTILVIFRRLYPLFSSLISHILSSHFRWQSESNIILLWLFLNVLSIDIRLLMHLLILLILIIYLLVEICLLFLDRILLFFLITSFLTLEICWFFFIEVGVVFVCTFFLLIWGLKISIRVVVYFIIIFYIVKVLILIWNLLERPFAKIRSLIF